MQRHQDAWVEIDGCCEHQLGIRVFCVAIADGESWYGRLPTGGLMGPSLNREQAKYLTFPDNVHWLREARVWAPTAENRIRDLNPKVSSQPFKPGLFDRPSGKPVQIWKIEIEGAPPFWILTRGGVVELSYRSNEEQMAINAAKVLWEFGYVEFS